MSFRLVPKSVTLNDLERRNGRYIALYFTELGKPALQKTMCGGIYARVYCIFSACTMSSQRKFTFAISSPDEFLVSFSVSWVMLSWVACARGTIFLWELY